YNKQTTILQRWGHKVRSNTRTVGKLLVCCWRGDCRLQTSELFYQSCSDDQGFDQNYAGIFHFDFWWYGNWKEVIIDDYLPTNGYRPIYGRNRSQPDEFWTCLLEKAYAKLHRCYEALDGGKLQDALVDLTGGISEVIDLEDKSKVSKSLYDILWKSFHMQTMMGCSIKRPKGATASEIEKSNGLYIGHAYSVTSFAVVSSFSYTVNHCMVQARNLRSSVDKMLVSSRKDFYAHQVQSPMEAPYDDGPMTLKSLNTDLLYK
ncbi:hypothetical protein ScPMuIL_004350, partial [Solemya velum]